MPLQSNSLVYSPGIRISIACRALGGEIIDVSEDIVQGNLTINENNSHQLSFSLTNERGKYSHNPNGKNTSLFTPNDRITVAMKRIKWVQVFSGYLTSVPYFSLFPQSVSLTAECTMKKLRYQLWDPNYQPNLTWMQSLIDGSYSTSSNGTPPSDAGMSAVIKGLLTDVAGWDKSRIHIGGIPAEWMSNLMPIFQTVKGEIDQENATFAASTLGQQFYSSGNATGSTTGAAATSQGLTGPTWNGNSPPSDGGADIPLADGVATYYDLTQSEGPNTPGAITDPIPLHVDSYWAAVGWPYYIDKTQASWTPAKNYLKGPTGKGLPIVVTNRDNGKQVVVRAADFEEARYSERPNAAIDLSPQAFSDISSSGGTSEGTLNVHVAWAADPNQAIGRVVTPVATSPQHVDTPVSKTSAHSNPGGRNGMPSNTGTTTVTQTTGGPAAAAVALQQVGKPYGRSSGNPPPSFDCSSLVAWAWASQGVDIGSVTTSQYNSPNVTLVDLSSILPGDLLFVYDANGTSGPPDHVAMYVGNNQVVEAGGGGNPIGVSYLKDPNGNASGNWWGLNTPYLTQRGGYFMGVGRVTSTTTATAKSGGPASVDGLPAATGLNSQSPMFYGTGQWNPAAAQADQYALAYTGLRLLMNQSDTSLLPNIAQIASAGLRNFCSAPNGDFIAWFADYFGQYGYAAVWELSPVELISTQITWSDANLKTHEFVVGSSSTTNPSVNPLAGGLAPTLANQLASYGVATIDVPGLLKAVTNVGPDDSGLFADPSAIYQQFGARVEYNSMSYIAANSPVEFWFAVQNFRKSIAKQFQSTISLTFMPELWPGMLLRLTEVGFQAYITSVTHTFNLTTGGGFSTSVGLMAPSALDGSGLIGLAKSGAYG